MAVEGVELAVRILAGRGRLPGRHPAVHRVLRYRKHVTFRFTTIEPFATGLHNYELRDQQGALTQTPSWGRSTVGCAGLNCTPIHLGEQPHQAKAPDKEGARWHGHDS